MPPVLADELAVRVHQPDASPTVVLVHGAPDRASTFRALLGHLGDLRVVTYDRRGYGRAVDAAPATSIADHARDLLALVADQPAPVAVVANSMGGLTAMVAAALDPSAFGALGLWEPALPWVDWWPESTKDILREMEAAEDPGPAGERMARQILGEEAWAALGPEGRALRRAEGRALQVDFTGALRAPFEFADVAVPTVVAYGTASLEDRIRGAPWMAARMPDARVFVVEGATHFGHRTHPEGFARFVRAVIGLLPAG